MQSAESFEAVLSELQPSYILNQAVTAMTPPAAVLIGVVLPRGLPRVRAQCQGFEMKQKTRAESKRDGG